MGFLDLGVVVHPPLSLCLSFVQFRFLLLAFVWWVRGVWFLIHVSSACFFHCCLALSRDGGFWHNFGSCIALLTCLYCDFNVISLLLDTLPLGVSGLSVSGRFLRCFRPELPPGRGDCVKAFAGNVPMPPKLRQRRNDAGQLGDSSSGFAAWRSC